jgi:hypothetical protein
LAINSKQAKADHAAAQRNRIAARRVLGLCGCGHERDDPTLLLCASCREKTRNKYHKRVSTPEGKKTRKETARVYYHKHKRKYSATDNGKNARIKMTVFNAYGGPICACCGETLLQGLQIDHMDGKGGQHRAEIRLTTGGTPFYRWLIENNFPPGYQVLCATCNFAKRDTSVCPHKLLCLPHPDQLNLFDPKDK